jgi:hypothetical protein
LSAAGTGFGIYAAASGAMNLLGPLGIAVLLGLAGYTLFKWAEMNESSPLDRWARRCFFGKHNENPPVHWDKPLHASIAIAELNAATFGVEADTKFNLRQYNVSLPQAGYSIASDRVPSSQSSLGYRMVLPHFDANRSAYCWTLTVHHQGGGLSKHFSTSEVIAEGSLNYPARAATKQVVIRAISASDHKNSIHTPFTNIRNNQLFDGSTVQVKDVYGSIILIEGAEKSNVEAATLALTYWPDSEVVDAYAELIVTSKNTLTR